MSMVQRSLLLFVGLFALFVVIGWALGAANITLLLVQSFAYALVALGLNIQWGYGGLFNFGIMGMLMLGGAAVSFISYPINPEFWGSDGPMMLGRALIAFLAGGCWSGACRSPTGSAFAAAGKRCSPSSPGSPPTRSIAARSIRPRPISRAVERLGRRPRPPSGAGLAVRRRARRRRRLCRGPYLRSAFAPTISPSPPSAFPRSSEPCSRTWTG